MTDKLSNDRSDVSLTNSLQLKTILEMNVSLMNQLIPKLKEYDVICDDVFKKLGLERSKESLIKVRYDLDMQIIAEKKVNVIVIQPQYFMDKDKSELEFVLAHEIGHHKFPGWLKAAQLVPLVGCSLLSMKWGFAVLPTITLCGVMIASTIISKRFEESWCDKFAAKHIGVEGGIKHFRFLNEKYQKLTWSQRIWNYDFAHPSLASRLKVLEKLRDNVKV